MKTSNRFLAIFLFLVLSFCGQNPVPEILLGGTETGTTDPDYLNPDSENYGGNAADQSKSLGQKIQALGVALIPSVDFSPSSDLSALPAMSYGDLDGWDRYVEHGWVLTDIFGGLGTDEEPAPVTRIHVLLNSFRRTLESLTIVDGAFSCSGDSELDEGDWIELPFYGKVENGSAKDRYFDCIKSTSKPGDSEGDVHQILYGVGEDGALRVAAISKSLRANEEVVETRGNRVQGSRVTYAIYIDHEGSEETVGHLNLQYSQATIYSGIDEEFGSSDDVLFKSQSRILGVAALDPLLNAKASAGEFSITKFDQSSEHSDSTKIIGRGDYAEYGHSLIKIDSSYSSLSDLADDSYCIQQASEGFDSPSLADDENCAGFEGRYAWDEGVFLLSPNFALESAFDEKAYFETSSLIQVDGSNFIIPNYKVLDSP